MFWSNENLSLEVPFPKASDRPLIVYHPAAGPNYLSSWSIMVENNQPFILLCDDIGPHYPDDWPFLRDVVESEYFVRMYNPLIGGRAYRNPELGFENMLIHRSIDVKDAIHDLPLVDILYLDWLDPFFENVDSEKSFEKIIQKVAKLVRDDGLIILDNKHKDAIPNWFIHTSSFFDLNPNLSVEYLGVGDWPIPYVNIEGVRSVMADLFKVKNRKTTHNTFDFLAKLNHERRLNVEDLERIKSMPPRRFPGHPDRDTWLENYLNHLDTPKYFPKPQYPFPTEYVWKQSEYEKWIENLIEKSDQLRPVRRKERSIIINGVEIVFVHGDILDHLDWLKSQNASLLLRKKLFSECEKKMYATMENSPRIQRDFYSCKISNLKWSEPNSTKDLTLKLLDLAQTNIAATIAHGDASISQLENQICQYKNHVKKLIIFHLDEDDYSS